MHDHITMHITSLFARLHAAYLHHVDRLDRLDRLAPPPGGSRLRSDRGQATTEYALVLLAAALVGLLVVGWATAGGGAAKVGRLFDRVIDSVIDRV
ncbi:MAG: hypothetical protein ACRDZZ_00830 [Ilumatobacteraceae bacterium]